MNNLTEIKAVNEQKLTALMNECGVFFAFSQNQFEKNKTPKQEDEKYVSMGGGGYLPKSKANAWLEGCKELDAWFKEATKSAKIRKENILYELGNHECYYTGDIQSAVDALGDGYTYDEVLKVYCVGLKANKSGW